MVECAVTNTKRIELEVIYELMGATMFEEHQAHFDSTLNGLDSHYTCLLKAAVRQYLVLRHHHAAKVTTISTTGRPVRHKLTKQILFSHQ
jgi:hypothetical protein